MDENGIWIRSNRERLGLSRLELAEKVRVSETYIGKLEQGVKNASPKLRFRLKEVFGFGPVSDVVDHAVGDIITIEGMAWRIVSVSRNFNKPPTVDVRSLVEELEI